MVSQPSAPDPYQTAAAQTASNKDTAGYQSRLNMVNQSTPYGSVSYNQTGTDSATGAPIYTATTSLSQPMQNLVDSNISNSTKSSGIASNLMDNVSAKLSQPVDLSYGANEARLDQLGRNTIDPQFQQAGNELQSSLMARGITPGSEQWNYAMTQFGNQKNNAYNNLYLQGHQTAVNDALTEHNQPLNELNALQSGSQVSQPGVGQTAATPQTQVAGTNVAGLVEQNYQNELANSNATMGGLFGLGGTLLNGGLRMFSDARLKTDIIRVGSLDNGLPVYAYRYIWGGPMQIGVMAQDVEHIHPDAVAEIGGFKAVDYARAVA